MTSSPHAPYVQGYTRATLAHTEGCDTARWSESLKVRLGSDCRLKFACMKAELLVIADQRCPGCGPVARRIRAVARPSRPGGVRQTGPSMSTEPGWMTALRTSSPTAWG